MSFTRLVTKCRVLCCSFLLIFFSNASQAAQESAADTGQLQQVEELIEGLQHKVQDTEEQYHILQKQLRITEQDIGRLAAHMKQLEEERRDKQKNLKQLRAEHQTQQKLLREQQQRLSRQIRAAYIAGRRDYLRLLLNQEDPADVGRALTYYDYFNRARAGNINHLHAVLERMDILAAQLEAEESELKKIISNESAQKKNLETQQAQRQSVLGELSVLLKDQRRHLAYLEEDKIFLKKLLGELGQTGNDQEDSVFAVLRGSLKKPVKGRIDKKYGAARGVGSLKWQGLLISADTGSKVRGVASGRVVFADWLRNFGQLLIIEHDKYYMSLYGHNQSLYKKVGDKVAAGEVIADVGSSGGHDKPGLYFEIRFQGEPIDPLAWFKSP